MSVKVKVMFYLENRNEIAPKLAHAFAEGRISRYIVEQIMRGEPIRPKTAKKVEAAVPEARFRAVFEE